MTEILLNGEWELREEPLTTTAADAEKVAGTADGWIATPVPGDIHQGLIAAGRIDEPLLGMNSWDYHWTEDRSWWYRKQFATRKEWLKGDGVELQIGGLDADAHIWLNGTLLGRHKNAFYPFVARVEQLLKPSGRNVLLVRLTTGVKELNADDVASMSMLAPTESHNGKPERGDPLRIFVRKPQYSWGWDWSPRVPTTAIAGDVKLRVLDKLVVRDVHVLPQRQGKDVQLTVAVAVDWIHDWQTAEGRVDLTITGPDGKKIKAGREVFLRSGINRYPIEVTVKNAQLWWPNGMGEPNLYTIEATAAAQGATAVYPKFDYGIRFVELDTKDKFALVINGEKVFCKGGNWIPADTIYARVTDQKYEALVREAQQANCNMLRVWGGGLYEGDAFYNACDRCGIMLWHDFMFSVAPYPDHLEWFREEVRREAEFQTVRLRNHPSVVLWSGDNENNWFLAGHWRASTRGGFYLYNYLLPEIVHRNVPDVPYWNGSPYGGEEPNCEQVGDRHHWWDCMMNPEMENRITPERYDACGSKFISEYGYVGAPVKESVQTYMAGAPFDRYSELWLHHNNAFEKETVDAGITKHYKDAREISEEEYFLYSGLTQGLMYGYSLETFRSRPDCHGGIFWMYNDCWGEVGWTIIDYYLRRKISWHFVRRAFAPVRLILRETDGVVRITLANDTREPVKGAVVFGRTSLDGRNTKFREKAFQAGPMARTVIATFKRDQADPAANLWVARVKGSRDILPAILRSTDFRNLAMPKPKLSLKVEKAGKGQWKVRVASDVYAHAVHLGLPKNAASDEDYFDLLPGESREVLVRCAGTLSAKNVTLTSVV